MSLFSSKTELGVVFHIGSASVGAGLVRFTKGAAPQVIFTVRELLSEKATSSKDAERLLSQMIAALERANERIIHEGASHLKFTEFGGLKVKRVMHIFSSPWSVTQTRVVSIDEETPFELTEALIEKIAQDVGGVANEIAKELTIIERKVVQITLNGYELADPYGKKAKSAQISIFMSLVPNMVLEKVRQITIAAFHPKGTNAHTLALASFSTIRDTFQTAPDFLYLDIGGELSDVAVTKDGLLLESASFPAGRNTIVSAAAKAFATSPEQASSLIRLYEEGKLDDTTKEKVRPVLDEAGENWMKSLSDALTRLSDHVSLPKESYAVIDGDLLPFFMRTLSAGSFSPTLVSADRLKDSVSFSEHAEKDAFIAIASAFAARAYDMI